jgi:uncharacterized protein YggE
MYHNGDMNKNIISSTIAVVGVILFALILIDIFHISYPISVITSSRSSELSVVGEGKVDVVPDSAQVNLGIMVTNKPTVAEVQAIMDQTHNGIVAAMEELGIKKQDITTSSYSINPLLDYSDNQNKQIGFSGAASLSVKVRKTALLAQVIQEATAAGANEVQGTSYSVENPDKYREQAREQAISNAKEQAKKLAKTLGIRLGKVTNIVESNVNGGPIMYDKAVPAMGMGGGGGPEMQPGSQTISSVVTLYFEKN